SRVAERSDAEARYGYVERGFRKAIRVQHLSPRRPVQTARGGLRPGEAHSPLGWRRRLQLDLRGRDERYCQATIRRRAQTVHRSARSEFRLPFDRRERCRKKGSRGGPSPSVRSALQPRLTKRRPSRRPADELRQSGDLLFRRGGVCCQALVELGGAVE